MQAPGARVDLEQRHGSETPLHTHDGSHERTVSVVVEQTEKAGTQEDSQSQIGLELIIRQTRPARAMISAELQLEVFLEHGPAD